MENNKILLFYCFKIILYKDEYVLFCFRGMICIYKIKWIDDLSFVSYFIIKSLIENEFLKVVKRVVS